MANPAGVLFGVDISHHQGAISHAAIRAAGFDYVIARVGQAAGGKYANTQDRNWARNRVEAPKHGLILVAYFYIGDKRTPDQNAALAKQWIGDASIPIALDFEEGSGNLAHYDACFAAFQRAGLNVIRLDYIPRWYWNQVGSPSLVGKRLWSSRYPNNHPGSKFSEYAEVPESYWNGYGGAPIVVLQYTSAGRIDGYDGNLDFNAFKGTRSDFLALIGAGQETPESEDEDDMIGYHKSVTPNAGADEYRTVVDFPFEIGPGSAHASRGFVSVSASYGEIQVRAWGKAKGTNGESILVPLPEETTSGEDVRLSSFNVPMNAAYTWQLPSPLTGIVFDVIRLTTPEGPQVEAGFAVWGDHKA